MNTPTDIELDFARIFTIQGSQVLLYRKKKRLTAISRLKVKGKTYGTFTVEREFETAQELHLMFLQHQTLFTIEVPLLQDVFGIPRLKDVAMEMYLKMKEEALSAT